MATTLLRPLLLVATMALSMAACGDGTERHPVDATSAEILAEVDAGCVPACEGKECGDDGCGGSCGGCAPGEICDDGECIGCTPDCEGKECGDDGCGGDCGDCGPDGACVGGICTCPCSPDCEGKECGGDDCGGSCGTCKVGETCVEGTCLTPCELACVGKECGDDTCGGSCGSCGVGLVCQDGVCLPSETDKLGAACGVYDGCAETIVDPATGTYVDNPDWSACVDAQCGGEYCFEPYCTRNCAIAKDMVINATGEPGFDYIDDGDGPIDPCKDAVDGPMGDSFRCVSLGYCEYGTCSFCLAGTTFAHCQISEDCPEGETCRWSEIGGYLDKRCFAAPKEGNTVGEACNTDPWKGPLVSCSSMACFLDSVCIEPCQDGGDCVLTPGACQDGVCATSSASTPCSSDMDCSPLECRDLTSGPFVLYVAEDVFCLPKWCHTSRDCGDDGFSCVLDASSDWWNGADDYDPSFDLDLPQRCLPIPPGAVSMGEECDPGPYPETPCAEGVCPRGICLGLCQSQDDCPETMACVRDELPITTFEWAPYSPESFGFDLCRWLGQASASPCSKDADCGADASCVPLAMIQGDACELELQCALPEPSATLEEGQPCTASDSVASLMNESGVALACQTSLCLVDGAFLPGEGTCTSICSSQEDCAPLQASIEGSPEGARVCDSVIWHYGADLSGVDGLSGWGDELWLPVCRPTGYGGSLDDCADGFVCATEGETCVPHVMSRGCGEPCPVEYLCQAPLSATPLAALGEPCDPFSLEPVCEGGVCLRGAGGEGYCSALCATDTDCATEVTTMACEPYDPLWCPGDTGTCQVPLCQERVSCKGCETHEDCGDGYVCVNVGGVGMSTEYRCAPECSLSFDCLGVEGGLDCHTSVDAYGEYEDVKACMPTCW